MKKFLIILAALSAFTMGVPPTQAFDSVFDGVGEAVENAAQSITDAAQEAIEATRTKPSEIYQGGFFNAQGEGRYDLAQVVDVFLPGVARWIAGFLAALAVIFLIYAGIQFLTAGGEEEKISEAIKTALYVVAGLLLTMFAYALVYLFLTLFSP